MFIHFKMFSLFKFVLWKRNFVSAVNHCFNMFHKKIINISYISMRCNAILVIYIRKWIIINFLRIYEN